MKKLSNTLLIRKACIPKVKKSIMFDNSSVYDLIASLPVKGPSNVTLQKITTLVQALTEIKETLEDVDLL